MARKIIVDGNGGAQLQFNLQMPGTLTRTSWQLPKRLSVDDWVACGLALVKIEGAVQWWLGDWWDFGERSYGERKALFDEVGPLREMNFETVKQYGWVARSVKTCERSHVLSWYHHFVVAKLSAAQQRKWLDRAVREVWSSNQLKSAIARAAAIEKTKAADLAASKLGKFAVLYADPPWQYEHPPMGGTNRSIENHYPTMLLGEICALPLAEVAHADSVLFMWATNPKLYECMKVLDAWGFEYRTDMVWIKDKIGMGYYVRGKHESLLIARRGALPVPTEDNRPDSVIQAPRLEHSAKPEIVYDIIDRMYPDIRKVELFSRATVARELWTTWGNQA